MRLIDPVRNFYGRYERPISSVSLILGFVFDAITLKRVDTLFESLWILGHLVVIGIFIILIHVKESEEGSEKNPSKAHFWYVNILQFFFGGILSTYLVFYFRSVDIFATWPFIALLLVAFIANESLKRHYIRLNFQISLLFLSIYSFMIYIIPVLLHKIGAGVFLLSGIASLVIISLFNSFLFHLTKDKFNKSKKAVNSIIFSIFILVNFLYFTNLIPPIPLSLKDTGTYHSIQKNSNGSYTTTHEDYSWTRYFKLYPNFKTTAGSPVYVFSAIFSPKNLNLTIVHEWQHYDEKKSKWVTESEISLSVVGGREGGFRTFSTRSNIASGKWRVNIKTQSGQVIGSERFDMSYVDKKPTLITKIK